MYSDQFIYILLYSIGFVIAILITRAVFSIGAIVRNLKAQTALLSKIAEKQGLTKEEIHKATLVLQTQ